MAPRNQKFLTMMIDQSSSFFIFVFFFSTLSTKLHPDYSCVCFLFEYSALLFLTDNFLAINTPNTRRMKTTAFALLALSASSNAFAPASQGSIQSSRTQLHAESRRDALGAIGAALGGLALPGVSNALTNPALETFKGGKKTKGAFIPGKVGFP